MQKTIALSIVLVLTATLIVGATLAADQSAFAGGHKKKRHHHHSGGDCNGGSICQSNEQSIDQHSTSGDNTATQTASNNVCIGSGPNCGRSQ